MITPPNNHWLRVAFIVYCGEALALVTSRMDGEPAWHRLAIRQGLACARARAMLGGSLEDDGCDDPDGAIILDGQYFDHYDLEALSDALSSCLNATRNTVSEVNEPEAELLNAATAISCAAMSLAFHADESGLVAATLSWMRTAGEQYGLSAASCLEALATAEESLELQPFDPVPEHAWKLLNDAT